VDDFAWLDTKAAVQNFPFYLRKIDKRDDWPDDPDALKSLSDLQQAVFSLNSGDHPSLFHIDSRRSLVRVCIALNGNRPSLFNNLFLVPVFDADVQGVKLVATPGDTKCFFANHRHFEAHFLNDEHAQSVLKVMLANRRVRLDLTRGNMKQAAVFAAGEKCAAAVQAGDGACVCLTEDIARSLAEQINTLTISRARKLANYLEQVHGIKQWPQPE
jgi:hypothetical protein